MTVTDHTVPIPGLAPDIEDLSTYFAKIITSRHNQHAMVMFVGSAGKGKSWAAIALARGVAVKVAGILGGNPDDYFNFKDTFATISKDEVKRVMTNPKPHTILLLDDVAAYAMNARNYKDKDNIEFNAELTTFRPNHNLVIMTTQAGFLLDKVPKSLSHFIIEMEQAYFDYGFTIAKVKQVVYHHSSQKLHFPYLQAGAQKYIRHIFNSPPSEIMEEYEKMRDHQLQKSAEKQEEIIQQKVKPDLKKQLVPFVEGMMVEFGLTQKKACQFFGLTPQYYQQIKAKQQNSI